MPGIERGLELPGESGVCRVNQISCIIKMYFKEHGVPHFHAIYGEYNGVLNIKTLDLMEGDLPKRAHRLVKEWAAKYQAELVEMWKTQKFTQLPGLE